MLSTIIKNVNAIPLITAKTSIGSAGSCFATEISSYLRANSFNYIVTEKNELSCANWGLIYNTPSFRQLIEFSFGYKKRPSIVFESEETGRKEYWDPFRENIFFRSIEEYEESTAKHLAAAYEALTKVKVFIMTVGLNEIWRLHCDHSVIARYPRTIAPAFIYNQVLTAEENTTELQTMLNLWKMHNPDIKIIITISPVPLHATFRAHESHVISSTFHSKSVLRIAVDNFVKANPDRVFYFPAYEVVSYGIEDPWKADCRHVTKETVEKVMALFKKMFITS